MSIKLLFSHGWGFDASFFYKLGKLLIDFPQVHLEHCYFSSKPIKFDDTLQDRWIGIGHSFGLSKLLNYPLHGIISLAGFTKFCRNNDDTSGYSMRILDKMIAATQSNPMGVLKNFYQRCYVNKKISTSININHLIRDLKIMSHLNKMDALNQFNIPVLGMIAKDDHIISKGLFMDNFKNTSKFELICFKKGGHGLAFNQPQPCAEVIKQWIYHVI